MFQCLNAYLFPKLEAEIEYRVKRPVIAEWLSKSLEIIGICAIRRPSNFLLVFHCNYGSTHEIVT